MSKDALITRDFLGVTLAHFLQALGFASMVLLPVYLDHLGASRSQIGWVMASASVSGLASRPAVAWSLGRFGRKPTLVVGTLILSAGMVAFLPVTSVGPLVVAARLLVGVGTGTLFTAYFALASEIVPEARRTQGIALFGISGLVPLLINPFAQQIGVEAAQLQVFFAWLGLLILVSLVPLIWVREPPTLVGAKPPTWPEALQALRRPELRSVWLSVIALASLAASFMAFVTVAAQARGAQSPANFWFAYAGGAAAVRIFFGAVDQRLEPQRLVPVAFFVFAGAGGIAAFASSDGAFLLAGLLAGLGHGIGFPILMSISVTRTPAAIRGAGMATLTGFWELATLVSTPAFGLVADLAGDKVMFLALGLLGLAAAALWPVLDRQSSTRRA